MASTHRLHRVREQLHRAISDIVRSLKDPRVQFVTVVDIEVSVDLRHVKMFVSVLGSEDDRVEALAALASASGHIRSEVGRRVRLRHTPEITVAHDPTAERAARLTAIIDQAAAVTAAGATESGDDIDGDDG